MISHSGIKTVFLLTTLTGLMLLLGYPLGGSSGLVVGFAFALLTNVFAYWNSDKVALAMAGARPVSRAEALGLHRIVEEFAIYAGIPKPRVYVVESPSPNAFATGRDPQHAAVAVTTGILRLLDDDELAGVIAHELAHIKNRDTLIQTVVATIAGTIMFLVQMAQFTALFGGFGRSDDDGEHLNPIGMLVAILIAPIAATLIQLAISRTREYAADADGARICGSPLGLARALEKLEIGARLRPMAVSPAAAHLFIVQPLRGEGLAGLFSTHPPIPERVARLRQMAYQADLTPAYL